MSAAISIEIRRIQLSRLVDVLRDLTVTLSLDTSCQWTPHFRRCLAHAEELLVSGFTQEQLAALSTSITHCFGGAGSFSDYAPGSYDRSTGRYLALSGAENFEIYAHAVCEQATELRVIGRY
jgi:hypothetical protein